MSAVHTLNSHLSTVQAPDAIRSLPGWLMWRYEHGDGPKPRKVPYYTNGQRRSGIQGRPEDRNQLTTFEAARAAAARRGFDGVGLALMPEFNVCALDFDNCVANGRINPEVQELLATTYAEYSPSGLGIRAFYVGQLGNQKAHGEPFGFEAFSSKGFVTFTGNVLDSVDFMGNTNTVAPVDETVRQLCSKRFKRELTAQAGGDFNEEPIGLTPAQLASCLEVLDPDMHNDQWIQVGMAIHHETRGEGFALWDEWSAKGSKYPDSDTLASRWNTFGRSSDRQVTARSLVRLANEHGAHLVLNGPASPEEFDAMVEDAVAKKQQRFELIDAHVFAVLEPSQWMIKNVLPKAELIMLYGESGSGKSFMVLDMAMAVARGQVWRGNKVKQGRVVYIAAEAAKSFRKRVLAYGRHNDLDLAEVAEFKVIASAPNLLKELDAAALVASIGKADLVIVDTFAQSTPGGNENSGEDMGMALANCKTISKRTGATVLVVHHSGKDASKGARGWSGLRAAADAEFELLRSGDARALRTTKQKEADDDSVWGFKLETVNLGFDEDDDLITSCVVVEAENAVPGPQRVGKPLGVLAQIINDVIQEHAKAQTAGIECEAVIKEAMAVFAKTDDGLDKTRRDRVKRSLVNLCKGDEAPYMIEEDNTITVL